MEKILVTILGLEIIGMSWICYQLAKEISSLVIFTRRVEEMIIRVKDMK